MVKTMGISEQNGSMTIDLFGPGMTLLHKAGLAGLWMTLKALEEENNGKAELEWGCWERNSTSVKFVWTKREFFNELFERSFKIDKNGLIWFPALGEPAANAAHAVILQKTILGTFLQHGRSREADKAGDPKGIISIEIDASPYPYKFHRISNYAHQKLRFNPATINKLAGWCFPGGAVRHENIKDTTLKEPGCSYLALCYAPAGVIYFEILSRTTGVKPRYALVLPEISNLDEYSDFRETYIKYSVEQFFVSGVAEAGLRVVSELKRKMQNSPISSYCRVMSFGTLPWSKQQKSRIGMLTIQGLPEKSLLVFKICMSFFRAELIKRDKGEPFWDAPQMPELIAINLAGGREWWNGFADFVSDSEKCKHIYSYEKGGLMNMVEEKRAFPDGPERIFVMACHEAWNRRLGKLGEKARRERTSFTDLVGREFEKARVTFSRCKNAATLREAVTDFWSRAGSPIKELQEGWHDILPLLDEKNWLKGKDLALLALASYKPKHKELLDAIENLGQEENEGE